MEPSREDVANTVPSRLKAKLEIVIVCPGRSANRWPWARSHNRTFWSAPPDARKRPSVEKHNAETVPYTNKFLVKKNKLIKRMKMFLLYDQSLAEHSCQLRNPINGRSYRWNLWRRNWNWDGIGPRRRLNNGRQRSVKAGDDRWPKVWQSDHVRLMRNSSREGRTSRPTRGKCGLYRPPGKSTSANSTAGSWHLPTMIGVTSGRDWTRQRRRARNGREGLS